MKSFPDQIFLHTTDPIMDVVKPDPQMWRVLKSIATDPRKDLRRHNVLVLRSISQFYDRQLQAARPFEPVAEGRSYAI